MLLHKFVMMRMYSHDRELVEERSYCGENFRSPGEHMYAQVLCMFPPGQLCEDMHATYMQHEYHVACWRQQRTPFVHDHAHSPRRVAGGLLPVVLVRGKLAKLQRASCSA
jgi:hypothetical protein